VRVGLSSVGDEFGQKGHSRVPPGELAVVLKGTKMSIAALWHRDIAMSDEETRERWSSIGTRAPRFGFGPTFGNERWGKRRPLAPRSVRGRPCGTDRQSGECPVR
jgi:hypothetical protein